MKEAVVVDIFTTGGRPFFGEACMIALSCDGTRPEKFRRRDATPTPPTIDRR